ncbi:hypothetical protein NQ315_014115 [Exocentrus adspersus]|uniref:Reverse transcriptase n=1 Tax=Exocentrus adspersus TaxID=1586481 RepID=A0AAV8VWE3_9CUCU|nr:hypothetical protein NQ315_014115 [Exocentrus adspersus]
MGVPHWDRYLWNALYDDIFGLRLPQGVSLVGYADDMAILRCQPINTVVGHTPFDCRRWALEKEEVSKALGSEVNVNNMIRLMLQSERQWNFVGHFMGTIMSRKEEDERAEHVLYFKMQGSCSLEEKKKVISMPVDRPLIQREWPVGRPSRGTTEGTTEHPPADTPSWP